jgi:WD40 repeat protein
MTCPEVLMKLPEPGKLVRLALLGVALACGHTEPFGSQGYDTDQPFDPSPPLRLTLNRGPDRGPAWLPDGTGILYSTQLSDARDKDVCLALLPPTGGRQRALTCTLSTTGAQLREAIESAAPDSAGRLAFIAASSEPSAVLPASQSLVLGTVDRPGEYQPLLGLPYTSASGRLATGISQLHWSGKGRLVFLAEQVSTRRPCNGCELDTIRSGLEAVSLALDQSPATPEFVPGTDFASGVSPGSNEHEIYYTLGGDTRVYRKDLLTGEVAVAYDFGAAGLARDVDVVGTRMAAVVGGHASFSTDPSLGPVQWDSGGILHVVDFQTGSDVVLDGPGVFRRPRLSPDGSRVVAELYPLIITDVGEGIQDTTVSRAGDLYLIGQP